MKKSFLPIFLGVFILLGCSTLSYKYFGIAPLEGQHLEGTLLGPKPENDLPLSTCEPDAVNKGKCVVLLTAEWEKVRADIIELTNRLRACENQ